jgi:hypothetical protein
MNYSHYMTYPYQRDRAAFVAFIRDVQEIVLSAPNGSELCGSDGFTEPVINNEVLILGSKTTENPFSVLRIAANEPWPEHRYPILTIRTDKLPYDTVICACLLAFKHHFPSSTITTDGTSKDWANAIALYEYATERLAPVMEFHNE